MRIALDFDDVCVDAESYKHMTFARYTPNASFEVVSRSSIVESGLLSFEDYEKIKNEIYTDIEGSLENLKFRLGAVESIQRLVSLGYSVEVVTARFGPSLVVAEKILENAGLAIPITGVGYGVSKNDSLAHFDVFIDDDPGHLTRAIGIVSRLFIMTTKENQHFEHPSITRVNGWEEFLDILTTMES